MTASLGRDEILRRFEEFLDRTLAAEEPPQGVDRAILDALEGADEDDDSGGRCDSYSLWAAVTALTQEVRLEGRAFKELSDSLGERERELKHEVERRCRRDILGTLIDLHDRLARGLESARAGFEASAESAAPGSGIRVVISGAVPRLARLAIRLGWLKPAAAAGALPALIKGYELVLDRLNQTLDEFDARQILCQGQPFDPRRMNAIDKEDTSTVPEGTVLEVYRSGFEWNGELFRPAQVKVACAPATRNAVRDRTA